MSGARVRKAVIPAAGLGTRFLPATKAQPKEMVPVVDRPAIQYVVEEAARAGLTDVLLVTGRTKKAVEDHFDRAPELELELERKGKQELLDQVRGVAELATVHAVRQAEPLGLGHAVSMARAHVGEEPFAVLLPDDVMDPGVGLLDDMLAVHARLGTSVVALQRMAVEQVTAYGAADVDPVDGEERVVRVRGVVEKPAPEEAPSDLALIGRYVFTPEIFDALDRVEPGRGGEIQLTDAIGLLLADQGVHGWVFDWGRYDTGNVLGFLQANLELALARDDIGPEVRAWLGEVARRENLG